jgi:hypothetical protein
MIDLRIWLAIISAILGGRTGVTAIGRLSRVSAEPAVFAFTACFLHRILVGSPDGCGVMGLPASPIMLTIAHGPQSSHGGWAQSLARLAES